MSTYILHPANPHRSLILANAIKQLQSLPTNRAWAVDIKQYRKTRSGQQCRYYFGVICKTISDFTGCDPEEAHEYLATKFLPNGTYTIAGETLTRRKSTADLSTLDFEDYAERCRAWAAMELGLVIPLPNEFEDAA